MMNRLERLVEVRDKLAMAISTCDSRRDLAALSKQYRETLREIEELEGEGARDDEIGSILAECAADGESRAVRKSRTEV